ncbi:MAG: hypothetical protein RR863_04660 [Erysipelotrichaceae bacterium]
MKSVILSSMMIFISFVVMVSFSWWVQYDHLQNVLSTNTKRGIAYSMVQVRLKKVFDARDVMNYFEEYFEMNMIKDYHYKITLSGYMQEPLFVKIHIDAQDKNTRNAMHFEVEEAMLEELSDEE